MVLAERPSSRRSAVAVVVQLFSLHYHAVPLHRLAAFHAIDPRCAVIHRLRILVIWMMKTVPSALSWSRSAAGVVKRTSRTNSAGFETLVVVKPAARSCRADSITAASLAIAPANARTQTVDVVSSHVAKRRRFAVIPTSRYATRHFRARKRSLARTRCSSPANAKLKSKKLSAVHQRVVTATSTSHFRAMKSALGLSATASWRWH